MDSIFRKFSPFLHPSIPHPISNDRSNRKPDRSVWKTLFENSLWAEPETHWLEMHVTLNGERMTNVVSHCWTINQSHDEKHVTNRSPRSFRSREYPKQTRSLITKPLTLPPFLHLKNASSRKSSVQSGFSVELLETGKPYLAWNSSISNLNIVGGCGFELSKKRINGKWKNKRKRILTNILKITGRFWIDWCCFYCRSFLSGWVEGISLRVLFLVLCEHVELLECSLENTS